MRITNLLIILLAATLLLAAGCIDDTASTDGTDNTITVDSGGSDAAADGGSESATLVAGLVEERSELDKQLNQLRTEPGANTGEIAEVEDRIKNIDDKLVAAAEDNKDAVIHEIRALNENNPELAGKWAGLLAHRDLVDSPEAVLKAPLLPGGEDPLKAPLAPGGEDPLKAPIAPGGEDELQDPLAKPDIKLADKPYDGPTLNIEDLRDELDEIWRVRFETTFGPFEMEVYPELAPVHAVRFLELVEAGYYDDLHVHRIAPGWVVQWGDLIDRSTGRPYPQYGEKLDMIKNLNDEPVRFHNTKWTVTFAKAGPNTASTQPFINLGDNTQLDSQAGGHFTPFGYVVDGRENINGLVEEFTPAMEKAKADLEQEMKLQGAGEQDIQFAMMNDLAWGRFVPQYWDPFKQAKIIDAEIIERP